MLTGTLSASELGGDSELCSPCRHPLSRRTPAVRRQNDLALHSSTDLSFRIVRDLRLESRDVFWPDIGFVGNRGPDE